MMLTILENSFTAGQRLKHTASDQGEVERRTREAGSCLVIGINNIALGETTNHLCGTEWEVPVKSEDLPLTTKVPFVPAL